MSIHIIHIFGASGSGSTTLARALEKKYNYHLIDTDDAIWEQTDPPFTIRKSDDAARHYLGEELNKSTKAVISGAFVGWGDVFKDKVDLFIYMHLPLDVRLSRIQKREENRFKERVLPGGDLYLQHLDFLNWVSLYEELDQSKRSMAQHQQWLKNINKPLITINKELTIDELLEIIQPYL